MAKKKKEKNFSSFLNNPIDFTLVIAILLLLALGLIMVLSASSPSALSESGNSYKYFSKQLIFAILGLIAMAFISKIDYRFYQKFYKHAWWLSLILFALVLLIGKNVNGAKRWIYITETLSFQPSELVKFLMIIFYAGILVKDRDQLGMYGKGFIKHVCMLAPIIGLLLLQPHFSASIVIIGICSVMMITAGCKLWHFILTGGVVGLPAMIFLIIKEPYRLKRVVTFLDPWQDKTGDGWQVIQSLYAIGSGGLFGAGLGESKQKFLYIPEPHNDFIFSILGEELGFVGCAIVIILFAIFIWRGILIAMKAPDMFGSLVAIGITALVGIQVIINIAVVTSSMPATGMPLPFFSYGGTALFILLCEMGVLLNISRASAKNNAK
jgi:cell division protein FtsW